MKPQSAELVGCMLQYRRHHLLPPSGVAPARELVAASCLVRLSWFRLGEWIGQLEQWMHRNKVVVAFANKIARMAWACSRGRARSCPIAWCS